MTRCLVEIDDPALLFKLRNPTTTTCAEHAHSGQGRILEVLESLLGLWVQYPPLHPLHQNTKRQNKGRTKVEQRCEKGNSRKDRQERPEKSPNLSRRFRPSLLMFAGSSGILSAKFPYGCIDRSWPSIFPKPLVGFPSLESLCSRSRSHTQFSPTAFHSSCISFSTEATH